MAPEHGAQLQCRFTHSVTAEIRPHPSCPPNTDKEERSMVVGIIGLLVAIILIILILRLL